MRLLRQTILVATFAAMLASAPVSVVAQSKPTTTVTLASILSNGAALPYAKLCAMPIDTNTNPMTFTAPGWGVVTAGNLFCANVVTGAISGGLPVPDASQTNRATPIQYQFTLTITNSSGVAQNAPFILFNGVSGVTGSTFSLDAYAPPTTGVVPASTLLGFSSGLPSTCTSPSIWQLPGSATMYPCVAGVFAAGSMTFRGTYSASFAYGVNDVVIYSSVTYISSVSGNSSNTPSSSPSQWTVLGSGGSSTVYPATAGLAYFNGNAWGTSFAVPASAIVGLSDTQALTNKTVDGVTPSTMAFVDATSSIQTQLNSKASLAATTYSYRNAAKCRGGTAQSDDFTYYLSPQPSPGCVSVGNSPSGYFSFPPTATGLVYAIDKVELPPYWTSTDISIQFTTAATTGNVTWLVNYYCISDGATISAGTFGSAASITTTVNATANARTTSAVLTGFATTGCAAGASLTYQITRSQSDTAAQPALFFGATLIQHRSQ